MSLKPVVAEVNRPAVQESDQRCMLTEETQIRSGSVLPPSFRQVICIWNSMNNKKTERSKSGLPHLQKNQLCKEFKFSWKAWVEGYFQICLLLSRGRSKTSFSHTEKKLFSLCYYQLYYSYQNTPPPSTHTSFYTHTHTHLILMSHPSPPPAPLLYLDLSLGFS